MLRQISIISFLLCCANLVVAQQNGFVILTEEATQIAPFITKVYVTMPNGAATVTTITSEQIDVAQHDQQLNTIINGITSQGYKHTEAPYGWALSVSNNTQRWLRRLFFGYP